jgi:hypothetical protein
MSSRLLRLPLYYEMTEAAQHRVVRAIEAFFDTPNKARSRSYRAAEAAVGLPEVD